MVNIFAALDAQLSGAVDAVMSERLRFKPKGKADNLGKPVGAADGRAQVDVIGVFLDGDFDTGFADGDRRISAFNARAIQQDAWASVEIARFAPTNLPKKGDTIELLDQSGRKFEIVDVLKDGLTRLAFPLARK